ncbi:MAG: flagellar FliJ family protein [Deltaproteobacteria bacterium]|nr:flagellar FliJ family protein [Deltaproteobacteria bacterium]
MAVKPEYRLQTLLQLRERKKEAAEQHLAACLKALRTEQERQREMEEELTRLMNKRKEKMREYAETAMKGQMSAADAVSANVYIERLKELEVAQKHAIEGQKQVVAQKQEEVKSAQKSLTDAMQDLKALEKHREKFEDQVKHEQDTKQEESMDEIAQSIYLNRER